MAIAIKATVTERAPGWGVELTAGKGRKRLSLIISRWRMRGNAKGACRAEARRIIRALDTTGVEVVACRGGVRLRLGATTICWVRVVKVAA